MGEDLFVATGVEVAYGGKRRLNGERVGGVKVLHGVDLRIGRGETVGIVGESGSGKTTLGRALMRLIDIDARQHRLRRAGHHATAGGGRCGR